MGRWRLYLYSMLTILPYSNAFLTPHQQQPPQTISKSHSRFARAFADEVCVGDLLRDLPTPCLLLELSLAEGFIQSQTLDIILKDPYHVDTSILNGSLFVHTTVVDTSARDIIASEQGSGKSEVICKVDFSSGQNSGFDSYLGIGLANHHVGGYYWARGMGIGASLPAHGVHFRESTDGVDGDATGELYWKKRYSGLNAFETTEESSNSNDGKRSEWADFLMVNDTVQLVPESATKYLADSSFPLLFGVRRIGRPLGSDPVVEKIWARCDSSDESKSIPGWIPLEL